MAKAGLLSQKLSAEARTATAEGRLRVQRVGQVTEWLSPSTRPLAVAERLSLTRCVGNLSSIRQPLVVAGGAAEEMCPSRRPLAVAEWLCPSTACFDGVWWAGYQRECPARLDTKNCALRYTMHVISCIALFVQFATSVVYPHNPHDFHLKPHRPNIPWTLSHGSTANASMNVSSCYDQTATLMTVRKIKY